MADYIRREDAINAVESLPTWWADEGGYYGGMQQPRVALLEPEDTISAIENIPSADVAEVRHGEWKWRNGGECSECGFHNSNFDYNFCPNCGSYNGGKTGW